MPFSVTWHTVLDELGELPAGATFVTPITNKRFIVTETQEHRVIIEFQGSGNSRPLQRDQFETLYDRIEDAADGFDLDRLPPDADPYPTVLTLHPRFEIDDDENVIRLTDGPTTTQLVDGDYQHPDAESEDAARAEPDIDVYADALLLIDALERHPLDRPEDVETNVLVDLYTLLSDVQRDADDLRQEIADTLLDRLHHDRPVPGQYGSVQRTTRRRRTLKDDDEVLAILEDAGIDRERVLGVDRDKVDDALEVTELSESDVYEIEQTEYVRKAEVDEDVRETRLQGLKNRLADTDDEEAEELRQEIEDLEDRIEELTSFESGQSFHTRTSGES